MVEDLQARLRRLGMVKGTRQLAPALHSPLEPLRPSLNLPQPAYPSWDGQWANEPAPLESLLPGLRLERAASGSCFVLNHVYPLTHQHGADRLLELLSISPASAALFCHDERLAGLNFRDLLFLDTETTGLGGAGTIAFMVGLAFFEGDALVVRQLFCRDHGDEAAMLQMLAEIATSRSALVTFNGRSFDLPLLDGRYLMNRLDPISANLGQLPHLDLLPPSRRLWRSRLVSCSLGSLEQQLLGLRRSQQDVPGWAIPAIYLNYLRQGDGRDLARIFYHNENDMLSMATLAGRIIRQFERPDAGDEPLDLLSLGKWLLDLGRPEEAEACWRMAAGLDLPLVLYHELLHRLGTLLKQSGRRDEAVQLWQQIAVTSFDDVAAHVELAKHYEWHHRDLETALVWTRRALALVENGGHQSASWLRPELEHRLARLSHKHSGAIT